MLELERLTSGYAGARGIVVEAVSHRLNPGAFVCVIGRNGAGKSTLMRTIAGLQTALEGCARLKGRAVSDMSARDRAQTISVVTTERVSSPGLLARDVVELGRLPYTDWHGQLTTTDREIAEQAMQQAGAESYRTRAFDSLSDGERQRVMIARALAQTSQLMVLDEITAFLDLPGRVEVMSLLKRHAEQAGKIVLLSSHDLELSLELAAELWIVHDGKLASGKAVDLVRSGLIGMAFDSEDVVFDPSRQRFRFKADAEAGMDAY